MSAPVNTAAPVASVAPAPIARGSIASVTNGTWTGAAGFSYQWFRDGVAIPGETRSTHRVAAIDVGSALSAQVTASPTDLAAVATAVFSNVLDPAPATLIVEDGTGLANADSYCSVAQADAYHDARNNSAWTQLALGAKEVALRNATDYMERAYRFLWDGFRYTTAQRLSWPRWEVALRDNLYGYRWWPAYLGYNTVPELVQNACAELALRASAGPLTKDGAGVTVPTSGLVATQKTVGPITVKYESLAGGGAVSAAAQQTTYTAVDDMLQPFIGGDAYSGKLGRCA